MKKVTLFSGYIIVQNELYRDQDAITKLEKLIQDQEILDVISTLNGSFRFIIETSTQSFFGIDHFGGYSLFYRLYPKLEIIINPTQSAKLSDIEDKQLCSLLASGFCYGDNTIFKNIKECIPGILYSFDKSTKKLTSKEWFSIDFRQQKVSSKDELTSILLSLIPNNFPQSSLALTGGIDSRLLLSLFRKKGTKIQTLTYGTRDNPDMKLAIDISQKSQLEHLPIYLDKLDLEAYFNNKELLNFFKVGFLGRSLPFESDWVVSKILNDSTQWVTTGFTSFWLRSPYQDQVPVPTKSSLISKIVNSHSQQTLISSSKFRKLISENVVESMSNFQLDDFDSDYDRWNVENRQHKYIINSCNNYRNSGIEVFLPLFDRRLMEFLNVTSREQRLEQKIYMETIISDIFIKEDSYLKDIASTNPKFNNHIQETTPNPLNWKARLLKLDKQNINRILRTPNNPMYGIIQSVLRQSPNYLSLKIEDAFPTITKTIATLYDLNLTHSANHLNWLRNKKVVQINLLGIEIIGFLVENFAILIGNE